MVAKVQNGDWMKEMVTARQLVPKGSGKSVGKEGGQEGSFNHDDVTLRPELSTDNDDLDDRTHMYSMWPLQHPKPAPDNCLEPVTWVFR